MSAFGAVMFSSITSITAQTWISDASGNWDDPVNWSGSVVPDDGNAVADFSTLDIGATRTVTLGSSRKVGTLRFGDLAGTSGWTITTNASGDSSLTLGQGGTVPTVEVINNTAAIRVPLEGAHGWVKAGPGSFVLQGAANGYTGETRVLDGTLALNKASGVTSIPGDLVIAEAGTVLISGGSNQISDSALVTIKTGGTLNLNNRPEVIGQLVLDGGVITNNTGSPALVSQDGFDLRSGAVHSVLGGAGKMLTKSTAGTVVLTAANTFSGGTLILDGTLQVGNGGTGGSAGPSGSIITNYGRLVFNRGAGSALTVSSVISGPGVVVKTGPGTIAMTAANSYTGATIVSNGVLNISSSSTLGFGPIELAGGTLNTTANRSVNTAPLGNPIVVSGDSAITTTSPSGTVDLNFTNSSFSGTGGTLTFRNDGANDPTDLFDPRLSGGSFVFDRPIVIDNGAIGLTRLNAFNALGTTQTFNGPIAGTGSFRKSISAGAAGVTILNGQNSYSGTTTVTAGELQINGTLGTNSLIVSGSGTLSGSGVLGGAVTVQAGATLSPGNGAGTLTISNNVTLADGSKTVMDVGAAGLSDQVAGISELTCGGTLELNVSGNLSAGKTFQLFKAASYSGSFSSIHPPEPASGLVWNTNRLAVDGVLSVESTNLVVQPAISQCVRLPDRSVRFSFNGSIGLPYRVWACTNLALNLDTGSWILLTNGSFNQTIESFADPDAAQFKQRFYRVSVP